MTDQLVLLQTAVRAARAGAEALKPFAGRERSLDVVEKSRHDFVTAADLASQTAISAVIAAAHPDHRFLGEENSDRGMLVQPGPVWIVDPLDGTTNFIHGYLVYSVSVSCVENGTVLAGVVLDPTRDELFAAARGAGATLGGVPVRVSGRCSFQDALIGTGFPFRKLARVDQFLASFRAVLQDTAGIRRAGSAALDLAAVACGRFDGFWEEGLQPWDIAAGALLIEEAGGVITDFTGGAGYLESGNVCAGSPAVHTELRRRIEPHLVASRSGR